MLTVPARARDQRVSKGMTKYAGIGIFAMKWPKVSGDWCMAQLTFARKAIHRAKKQTRRTIQDFFERLVT